MPPKKVMSNRDFLLMITPVILALLVVSFTVGLYIAQRIASNQHKTIVAPEDFPAQPVQPVADPQVDPNSQVSTPGELAVTWLPTNQQKEVDTNVSFRRAMEEAVPQDMHYEGMGETDPQPGALDWIRTFELGTVNGGQYDGYALQLSIVAQQDMGVSYDHYYLLIPNNLTAKAVWLARYKTSTLNIFQTVGNGVEVDVAPGNSPYEVALSKSFTLDYGTEIPSLNVKDLTLANGATLTPISVGNYLGYTEGILSVTYPISVDASYTTNDGKTVYLRNAAVTSGRAEENLFYSIRPDGRLVWYDIKLPFWSVGPTEPQALEIRDKINGLYAGNYVKAEYGGCGYSTYTNVTTFPNDPTMIEQFGVITTNDANYKVYRPNAAGLAHLRNDAESWISWNQGKTVQDYIDTNPILYVKDGFGRWIELSNTLSAPMGECGKPVIYLYPPKTTDVSVQLAPVGGFTKTEPAYGNGWHVAAAPSGALLNKEDGKTYPYLFWEGRGGIYAEPENYWVLKREDIATGLPKILAQLGLNAQETKDFMEFWGPRMQAAPYYKIGFHGNRVMDALAPLTVSPKPQSTLRILMDYSELQSPIKANPPKLPAPFKRTGFTLVEWGGVIR